MKTLIIYDNEGTIILQQAGSYKIPQGGVQYLLTEIPEGKLAVSIDVETQKVILKDMPKTETSILKDELDQLKNDMADLMMVIPMGGMI